MTSITDRKINELERSVFAINVITTVSRFFVDEEKNNEIIERYKYIEEMFLSLEKYLELYNETSSSEYKNYLENNYDSAFESIEEQKKELYSLYPLQALLFIENIKKHNRKGFIDEILLVTNQFSNASDVSEYISYHGSIDLNIMINYIINNTTNQTHKQAFEKIKAMNIITYKKDEWLSLGNNVNSGLLDIKLKFQQNEEVDKLINKLSAYRFLLTIFDYAI